MTTSKPLTRIVLAAAAAACVVAPAAQARVATEPANPSDPALTHSVPPRVDGIGSKPKDAAVDGSDDVPRVTPISEPPQGRSIDWGSVAIGASGLLGLSVLAVLIGSVPMVHRQTARLRAAGRDRG
jgi:hypothetical protein